MEIQKPKPASHNENNFKDVESKSFVEHILSKHRRAIPKLDSVDKWPNIDGIIDFCDESKNLIGKFEAQVKTLSQDHNFKHPIPVPFIAYCDQVANFPVLLLLVDNNVEKVFWIHMSREFINKTNYKKYSSKSKVTTSLNPYDFFDKSKIDYIDKWEKILLVNKNIKKLSDSISSFIIKNDMYMSNSHDIFQSSIKDIIIVTHEDKVHDLKSFNNQNSLELKEVSSGKVIEQFIRTNIYNDSYDLLLGNVSLAVERRQHIGNKKVHVSLSNINQPDFFVYIKFELILDGVKVVNTKIRVAPMHKDNPLHQLMFLKFADKLKVSDKLIAYNIESGKSIFEGTVTAQDISNYTKEEIEYIKNIIEIERKLDINIKLPEISEQEDITNINNLYTIISTGRLELPELTMTYTFNESISSQEISKENIFLLSFISNDKYEIFNLKLDLGEKLYILPRIQVIDLQDTEMTVKSVGESKNIVIYKRFYGDYTLKDIMEKEKIGKFKST